MPLRALALAWAALVLIGMLIPRGAGVPLPAGGYDKLGHGLAFAPLAALLAGSFVAQGWPRGRVLVVTLAMTIGYGILTELAQGFVPGRVASLPDILADAVGAALGGAPVAFFTPPVEANDVETSSPANQ